MLARRLASWRVLAMNSPLRAAIVTFPEEKAFPSHTFFVASTKFSTEWPLACRNCYPAAEARVSSDLSLRGFWNHPMKTSELGEQQPGIPRKRAFIMQTNQPIHSDANAQMIGAR